MNSQVMSLKYSVLQRFSGSRFGVRPRNLFFSISGDIEVGNDSATF